MLMQLIRVVATVLVAAAAVAVNGAANAQTEPQRLALKNGESIELYSVYWVAACKSIMVGLPEVEIMDGPPTLALSIKEGQVLPRRQGCAAKVNGGTLMLTAKDVTEKTDAKLIYRLKYQTRDGPRETSHTYIVSLFPN
jgi:hypothetical protein